MASQQEHRDSTREVSILLELAHQLLETKTMAAPPEAVINLARLIAETTERRLLNAPS